MATQTATEKPDIRSHRLVVYITEADSQELYRVAENLGMSRSALVSSILERLIIGGFSPVVGAKLCRQLHRRLEDRGFPAKGLYFGIRPLPPLPDEELTRAESTELLEQLQTELKPC